MHNELCGELLIKPIIKKSAVQGRIKQPVLSDPKACATVDTAFVLSALQKRKSNSGKQQGGTQKPRKTDQRYRREHEILPTLFFQCSSKLILRFLFSCHCFC